MGGSPKDTVAAAPVPTASAITFEAKKGGNSMEASMAQDTPFALIQPETNIAKAVNYSPITTNLECFDRSSCGSNDTTDGTLASSTDSAVCERNPNKTPSCLKDTTSESAFDSVLPSRRSAPAGTTENASKSAVSYDMGLTPGVRRNKVFLHHCRVGEVSFGRDDGDAGVASPEATRPDPATPQRSSRRSRRSSAGDTNMTAPSSSGAIKVEPCIPIVEDPGSLDPCESCRHFPFCSQAHPERHPNEHPFPGDESVVWVPRSRSEWDDCADEMTAVCTEAALRRYAVQTATAARRAHEREVTGEPRIRGRPKGKPGKPPGPPLSREYIRDRIDIDDPLRGYQIRHRSGGWLQGFILTTTFTSWTHYFKWDSTHPKSGMRSAEEMTRPEWDWSVALGAELERQPRGGDPDHGGVIWPTVAEIGIVGALGCGEYLLRMALDDVLRRDCYDYVVLQATDTSRSFYERFGFVRVGAITKYGTAEAFAELQRRSKIPVDMRHKLPIVGYRHWTYADESSHRLSKHGGPSYMMALQVTRTHRDTTSTGHHCVECGRATSKVSFLDALSDCFVHEKPKVKATDICPKKPLALAPPRKISEASDLAVGSKPPDSMMSNCAVIVSPNSMDAHNSVLPTVSDGMHCTPSSLNKRKKLDGLTADHLPLKKRPKPASGDKWLTISPLPLIEMSTKCKNPQIRADSLRKPTMKELDSFDDDHNGKTKIKIKPKNPTNAPSKPLIKPPQIRPHSTKRVLSSKKKVAKLPQARKQSRCSSKKCTLRKQRISSMYRDPRKVYYYNKVVTPKKKEKSKQPQEKPYYFVLHYDEEKKIIQIIPLVATGTFKAGKRMGHLRWKATVVGDELKPSDGSEKEEQRYFSSMGVKTVSCGDWDIVPAHATNKGTGVADESWDIFD